jgi:hypothetical protein
MLKKILLSLLVIPVLGGLMYFYFNAKNKNNQRFELFDAIPNSFTWILQINDINKTLKNFSSEETIIDWLAKNPDNLESQLLIDELKKSIKTKGDFFQKIFGQKVAIGFFKKETSSNFVIYAECKLSKSDFFSFIDGNYSQENINTIKVFSTKFARTKIYFAYKNGLLIISKSSELVEKSLANFESTEKWKSNKSFAELWLGLNSNSDAYFIAKSREIGSTFPSYININPFETIGEISSNILVTSVSINEDNINGIGVANVSKSLFFSTLINQSPIELKTMELLPIGVSKLQLFGFSKPEEFSEKFFLDSFYLKTNKVFGASFKNWFLSEKISEIAKLEFRNSRFYVFNKLSNDWIWKPDSAFNTTDSNIYKIDIQNEIFAKSSIEISFDSIKYFSLYKNQIVFAEDKPNLLVYLKSLYENEVLGNKEISDVLKNVNSIKANFLQLEKKKFVLNATANSSEERWKEKNYFSMFSASMNDKVFEYSFLNSNKRKPIIYPDVMFSENCENNTLSNCVLYRDAEKELVVISGKNNVLEAFNLSGELQWKYKISGEILGRLNIVKFKEDKNILVFNTKEKLYFVNSKGQSIKGFPVKFESNSTSEVSILSNPAKEEYRITVPCENNKIYNYDGTGKALVDWNYPKFENKINQKVLGFSENGERYYATIDSENNLVLQGRKGKRINAKDSIFKYQSSLKKIVLDEKSKPVYFELDSTGYIKSFSSNTNKIISVSSGLNGVVDFLPLIQKNQVHFIAKVGSISYLLNDKGKIISKNNDAKNLSETYTSYENYLVWNDSKSNSIIYNNENLQTFSLSSSGSHYIFQLKDETVLMFYISNNKLIGRILN